MCTPPSADTAESCLRRFAQCVILGKSLTFFLSLPGFLICHRGVMLLPSRVVRGLNGIM